MYRDTTKLQASKRVINVSSTAQNFHKTVALIRCYEQLWHWQFSADSTCTKGETPGSQFSRLTILTLVRDGLQHSHFRLK